MKPMTLGCKGSLVAAGAVTWKVLSNWIYVIVAVAEEGDREAAYIGPAKDAATIGGLIARILDDEDAGCVSEGRYEAEWSDDGCFWLTFGGRAVTMDAMDADRLVAWLDEVAKEAGA